MNDNFEYENPSLLTRNYTLTIEDGCVTPSASDEIEVSSEHTPTYIGYGYEYTIALKDLIVGWPLVQAFESSNTEIANNYCGDYEWEVFEVG